MTHRDQILSRISQFHQERDTLRTQVNESNQRQRQREHTARLFEAAARQQLFGDSSRSLAEEWSPSWLTAVQAVEAPSTILNMQVPNSPAYGVALEVLRAAVDCVTPDCVTQDQFTDVLWQALEGLRVPEEDAWAGLGPGRSALREILRTAADLIRKPSSPAETPAERRDTADSSFDSDLRDPIPLPSENARAPEGVANGNQSDFELNLIKPTTRHSEDFTFVHWFGSDYHFTQRQGLVIGALWREWESAGGTVTGARINQLLDAVRDDHIRIRDIFKSKENGTYKAWGTMIQGVGKGRFWLVPPQSSQEVPTSPPLSPQ